MMILALLLISFAGSINGAIWIDYNARTVSLPSEFTFMNWDDALQHCRDNQAEPFIPYSAEDFEWMIQTLSNLRRKKMNFPMTDVDEEGTPKWYNGQVVPEGCDYLKKRGDSSGRNRGSTDYAFLTSEGIGWFSGSSTNYGMICEFQGSPREYECSPESIDNKTDQAPTPVTKAPVPIKRKPKNIAVDVVPTEYIPTEAQPRLSTPIMARMSTEEVSNLVTTDDMLLLAGISLDTTLHSLSETKTSVSTMNEEKTNDQVTTEHISTEAKTKLPLPIMARKAHEVSTPMATDGRMTTTDIDRILPTGAYHQHTPASGGRSNKNVEGYMLITVILVTIYA